jgi:hypothetical protein
MTVLVASLIAGAAGYLLFHLGAGSAHYRHAKAGCARTGHRRPNIWASLGRGPFVWLSVPLPGGFRIGRKL